eukprot:scaffold11.g3901.t1
MKQQKHQKEQQQREFLPEKGIAAAAAQSALGVAQQQQQLTPLEYVKRHEAGLPPTYSADCRAGGSNDFYSIDFLEGLRRDLKPVCSKQPQGPLGSSLECAFRGNRHIHKPIKEAFCRARNLALDLRELQAVYDVVASSVETPLRDRKADKAGTVLSALPAHCACADLQNFEPRLFEAPGAVAADCKLDAAAWNKSRWGLGGQHWLRTALHTVAPDPSMPPKCVAWVEHPLYFLHERWHRTNVWHGMEDVAHAFEAWALWSWGLDAQVSLAHAHACPGFTWSPAWRKAVSPVHRPASLRALVERAIQQAPAPLPEHAALCVREAGFSVHGFVSLITRPAAYTTPCRNSSLINAFVDWLLDGFGLAGVLPQWQAAGGTPTAAAPQIVLWSWRDTRTGSQDAILSLLKARLPEQRLPARVVNANFGRLGLEDQVALTRQADVLVGQHGSGLTLSLFLRRESALIEVGSQLCRCHSNLAIFMDRPFYLVPEGGDVAQRVLEKTLAALHVVRQRWQASSAGNPLLNVYEGPR